MPVIHTKFIGPTNYRGSRIKASAQSHTRGQPVSVTLSWDYALQPAAGNHRAAAQVLATREGWAGEWRCVEDVDGGTVFIRTSETHDGFTVPETRS